MTTASPTQSQLQERVANALRRLDALESTYESITIGQLVAMRARTHGSRAAIEIFERGQRATYSEIDRKSNRYARALRAFGVCKGDRIGIMLPNRIEFVILWLAMAKLGAVMVPINIHYMPSDVEFILSDTKAKFAIVDESTWPVLRAMNAWPQDLDKNRVFLVGQSSETGTNLDELVEDLDDSAIETDVRPDDLATIQYTSGTTGFPKGCMLTHEYWGVCSCACAYLDYQAYERYLCWSPFFYVFGQWLVLRTFRQGGTLYVAQQASWSRFLSWIRDYGIQSCSLPGRIAEAAGAPPRCLRQVSQYDFWSPETIRKFRERLGVRVQNGFGMTEIGYGTQVPRDIEEIDYVCSLGIRAPFRSLRLVGDDGRPTPVGEVGELWVSGRGIFTGYWNKPQANAECFEGEWFKTGDLFRRDELGFYWLVGRKNDIIQRSGDNIVAREVESVIREIPEIAEVAAVPVRDDNRGQEVKIYVELKREGCPSDLTVQRILEHARARLDVFKVPRYIAFTASLPRTTSSNKVLKRELMAIGDPLSGAYDSEERRWR